MSTTQGPPLPRARGRLDMPALRTRGAPKKFKGSPHEVAKFLAHLEKLFAQNNVNDGVDKIESMRDYCSRSVIQILDGMTHYITPNWPLLVTDMNTMFDADKDERRHRPQDLKKLTDVWRKRHMKSMTHWRRYQQEFTMIAGWLISHKLMEESEAARYLWQGLHPSLRLIVENRLLAKEPTRDMSIPFTRDEVTAVISARFKRGRFDADLASDSDTDFSSSSDSDSSSDSEMSDSDDDLPTHRKSKKKSKGKGRKKHTSSSHHKSTSAAASTAAAAKEPAKPAAATDNTTEVGELVKQLARMNIDDADYNYLYYRATTLDPHVARCVRAPVTHVKAPAAPPLPPLPPNNFRNNQYAPPADQFGANPNANVNRPPLQPQDRTCFGCGDRGHGLWECAKMAEALATGELRRGERGIECVWNNGTRSAKHSEHIRW
ncbi:hypothetical protein C8R47DRAFT_1080632 [Mycena vitilis]|nr:hypothetical protein C8R47DRAFT_1080632 [Mycena vitilis]